MERVGNNEDTALHKGLLSLRAHCWRILDGFGLAILSSIGISRITINLKPEISIILTTFCAFFAILFLYLNQNLINKQYIKITR